MLSAMHIAFVQASMLLGIGIQPFTLWCMCMFAHPQDAIAAKDRSFLLCSCGCRRFARRCLRCDRTKPTLSKAAVR